jgi:hypothetical protein
MTRVSALLFLLIAVAASAVALSEPTPRTAPSSGPEVSSPSSVRAAVARLGARPPIASVPAGPGSPPLGAPPGLYTATRYAVLAGRVLDEAGHPAANARVSLSVLTGGDQGHVDTRITGEDGRFAFQVWSGDYSVRATREGESSFALEPLSLKPGESMDGLELALVRGAYVRGRVLDEDEAAVAMAWVCVSEARDGPCRVVSYSGEDGTFAAGPLVPGPLHVRAERVTRSAELDVEAGATDVVLRLHPRDRLSVHVVNADGQPVEGQVMWVEVIGLEIKDTEHGTVSFALNPAARYRVWARSGEAASAEVAFDGDDAPRELTLRVEPAATVVGRVLDADGRPWSGEVELLRYDELVTSAESDADGRYRFDGVAAASYQVEAAEGAMSARGELTVIGHDAVEAPELVLARRDRVAGRVVDEAGQPVATACVQRTSGDGWTVDGCAAFSDEAGRFELDESVVGAVTLRAFRSGRASAAVEVTAQEGAFVELVLSDLGGEVDGLIRGSDGVGQEGLKVRCGRGAATSTSGSGRFTLSCAFDDAVIEVMTEGGVRRYPIALDPDQTTDVEIDL